MARAAYCLTENCTEHEIAKAIGDKFVLHPGEVVTCGECLQPCEVRDDSAGLDFEKDKE